MPPAILQKQALDAAEGATLPQPPIVTIETDRLILTTMTMDIVDEIMPMITDPDIMKWTSRPAVKSHQEATQWLSARTLGSDVFNFAIRLKETNELVGLLGTFHAPSHGYMISPTHTSHGYATEALRAFIPLYFTRFPSLEVLEGYADTENYASHRILEKCGFTRCEVNIGDFDNHAMGLRDTVAYRLARPGGRTLVEMGFVNGEGEGEPPVPPVQ